MSFGGTRKTLTTGISLGKAVSVTSRAGFLPWRLTGPVSHAEWKDVPVGAVEYRGLSPTTLSIDLKIPQSIAHRIYNTRYFVRDARRHTVSLRNTGSKIARTFPELQSHALGVQSRNIEAAESLFAQQSERVGLLEDPNSGFV